MRSDSSLVGSAAAYQQLWNIADQRSQGNWVARVFTNYAAWLLLLSILGLLGLQGEFATLQQSVRLIPWIVSFALFTLLFHVWRDWRPNYYDWLLVRRIRIFGNILLLSVLILLTGGHTSPFWYTYLLPLGAAALYSQKLTYPLAHWLVVGIIYLGVQLTEVSSAAASHALTIGSAITIWLQTGLGISLVNLSVLGITTFAGQHLVDMARRNKRALYDYAENLRQAVADLDLLTSRAEVLKTATHRAVHLVGGDSASIMLLDHSQQLLMIAAVVPPRPLGKIERGFRLGEGIAGAVAQSGTAYLTGRADRDRQMRSPQQADSIRSLCVVPIIGRGHTIGVLSVDSPEADLFNESDKLLLQAYARALADQIERARLHEALQVLRESSTLEFTDLLNRMLEQLQFLVPYFSASVFLVEADVLQVQSTWGHPYREDALAVRFRAGDDPLYLELVTTRRPIILTDAQLDGRFKQRGHTDFVRGWLGVPLVAQGEVIGMLGIDSQTPNAFTETDAQIAMLFANYAALSIQDVRGRLDREKKLEQLKAFHQAALVISSDLEIGQLATDVLETLHQLFRVEASSILKYDEARHTLSFVRVTLNGEIQPFGQLTIPVGKGIAGWAAQQRESILVRNVQGDRRWDNRFDRRTNFRTRSILAAPLLARGRLLGVVELINKRNGYFEDEDKLLLESMAAAVAIAMDNADLIERLRHQTDTLTAVNRSSLAIGTRLAEPDCLRRIIEEAVQLIGASGGAIYLLDASRTRLQIRVVVGLPGALEGQMVPLGQSAVGQSARLGQPIRIKDYYRYAGRLEILEPFRLTGVMAVPLIWRDERIGAIAVHDTVPGREFTAADAELLRMFGDYATFVIVHTQKEQFLESVISNSAEAIVAVDERGRIMEFNQRAENILGYTKPEALAWGERGVVRLYGGDLEQAREFNGRLRRQSRIINQRTELTTQSGEVVPVMLSAVSTDTGSLGFFRDLRDITRRDTLITLVSGLMRSLQGAITDSRPYETLEAVVRATRQALEAASVILYLYDEDRRLFRVPPIEDGVDNKQALSGVVRPGSLVEHVLTLEEALFVEDARIDPLTRNSRFRQQEGTGSLIAWPLVVEGRHLGALFCNLGTPRRFDLSTRQTLQDFGESAAVAIGNILKIEKIQREKMLLQLMARPLAGLNVDQDRLVGLAELVQEAADTLGVTTSGISLRHSETGQWRELPAGSPADHLYTSAVCVCGQACLSRHVEIVDDLANNPHIKQLTCACARYRSLAALPMIIGEQLLGIVWFADSRPYRLTEFERSDLTHLCQSLAVRTQAILLESQLQKANILRGLVPEPGQLIGTEFEDQFVGQVEQTIAQATGTRVRLGIVQAGQLKYRSQTAQELARPLADGRLSPFNQLADLALARRRPIHQPPALPGLDVPLALGVRSASVWPLLMEDEPLGVLEVYSTSPDGLGEADRQLLELAAGLLALELDFPRIFRAHTAIGQLTMVNEIGAFLIHRISAFTTNLVPALGTFLAQLPEAETVLREQGTVLETQIEYLDKLAYQLRKVAKGASQIRPVDIVASLTKAERLANVPAHIRVEKELADLVPLVSAAPELLTDVLLSLIANSVKAMGDRAGILHIVSRVSADREWVEVEVTDTGPGIPTEVQEYIFKPFYFEKKTWESGLGLGLWLCKLVVESWRGRIEIRSQPGTSAGAQAVVRLPVTTVLPLSAAGETTQTSRETRQAGVLRRRGAILVVDDQKAYCSRVSDYLRKQGCSTLTANDYESAMAIIQNTLLVGAVVDLRLDPYTTGADGARLAYLIRERWPEVPVVIMTAFSDAPEIKPLIADGIIRAVVTKPGIPGWDEFLTELFVALDLTDPAQEVANA